MARPKNFIGYIVADENDRVNIDMLTNKYPVEISRARERFQNSVILTDDITAQTHLLLRDCPNEKIIVTDFDDSLRAGISKARQFDRVWVVGEPELIAACGDRINAVCLVTIASTFYHGNDTLMPIIRSGYVKHVSSERLQSEQFDYYYESLVKKPRL